MSKNKGFTLIELVMIIVILGILASVAIPRYMDLVDEAKEAAAKGALGGLRSGVSIFYANHAATSTGHTTAWPTLAQMTATSSGVMERGMIPENPYNNSTGIQTSATKATVAGAYGWVYNSTSGEIWGNTTDSSTY